MKTILAFLLCLMFLGVKASCPKDSIGFGNSCYHFSTTTATWYDAERACFSRGGYLAIVESKQEDLFLINEVTNRKKNFWLGGTDEKVEDRWIWSITQQGISYTNWDILDHEPDGKRGQNCLGIYKSNKGNYYKWYDLDCSPRKMNFICETELQIQQTCACSRFLLNELFACRQQLKYQK